MRVIKEGPNCFYIEGIVSDGFFWVDLNTLMVNEEKTNRLLGEVENTLPRLIKLYGIGN